MCDSLKTDFIGFHTQTKKGTMMVYSDRCDSVVGPVVESPFSCLFSVGDRAGTWCHNASERKTFCFCSHCFFVGEGRPLR